MYSNRQTPHRAAATKSRCARSSIQRRARIDSDLKAQPGHARQCDGDAWNRLREPRDSTGMPSAFCASLLRRDRSSTAPITLKSRTPCSAWAPCCWRLVSWTGLNPSWSKPWRSTGNTLARPASKLPARCTHWRDCARLRNGYEESEALYRESTCASLNYSNPLHTPNTRRL